MSPTPPSRRPTFVVYEATWPGRGTQRRSLEVGEPVAVAYARAMTVDQDWSPTAQAMWARHCQATVWDIACWLHQAGARDALARRLQEVITTGDDPEDCHSRFRERIAQFERSAQHHRAVANEMLTRWIAVIDSDAAKLRSDAERAAQDDAYVWLALGEPVTPSDAAFALADAATIAFFAGVTERARATRAAWSPLRVSVTRRHEDELVAPPSVPDAP